MLGSIVIVGGGTAGWMTAAALSHHLRGVPITIRLVESEAIGTVGVGEATVPPIRRFNDSLGIREEDFIRETKATFKLGIEFIDWGQIGRAYIHPFDRFGPEGFPDFHQLVGAANNGQTLDRYSLATIMARQKKFDLRDDIDGQRHAALGFDYAYQFDASLYAAFLRKYSEGRGVIRTEGRIADIALRENGLVEKVTLEDGRDVEGDFFVDCSGFRSLLLGQTLGSEFESWEEWLPCDRAIAIPCEHDGNPAPMTQSVAQEAGWMWHIPLQHRMGNGHVYCSQFMDDDEAERQLIEALGGMPLAEPNRLRFKAGMRRQQWVGNCVAIGLSCGFLEPLESTSIHLIQTGIQQLLDRLPHGEPDQRDIAEYNRMMGFNFDDIRDFIILHYYATQRDDTPFWNHVRTMEVPDSLNSKIEAFRSRGLTPVRGHEFFLEHSWLSVLIGQCIFQEDAHPVAKAQSPVALEERLDSTRELFEALSGKMSDHRRYIENMVAIGQKA